MKLKGKVIVLSIISVTSLLLFLFLLVNPLLLERYRDLEETIMAENVKRVENAFNNEINRLSMIVRDYAVWDDTYEFIQDKNEDYIRSNWVDDTFLSNQIHMVLYFDENEDLIYEKGLNLNDETTFDIADEIDKEDLVSFYETRKSGLIAGKEHPIILASHRIYPSLKNQTSTGILIMGIIVDDALVDRIADNVQLPLVIEEQIILDTESSNDYNIQILDKEKVQGSTYFTYDNNLGNMELSFIVDRTVYQSGSDILTWFYIFYGIISVILTFFIVVILDKYFIVRLKNLSNEIKYIQETRDLRKRIVPRGKDEVGTLEHGFNQMLDSLKLSQHEIQELAMKDSLTGLPNRRHFVDQLNKMLEEDSQQKVTVIFLDIDLFKRVNDTLGHYSGDKLLQELSARLKSCFADNSLVGRWGGDEFVIAMTVVDESAIDKKAEELLKSISDPVELGSFVFDITMSMGISQYPEDGTTGESLIQNADIAMYEAKRSGKSQFKYYRDIKQLSYFQNYVTLERELKQALKNKEFVLYYQPIFSDGGKVISGVEALVRWIHPEKGLIPPFEFITAAEEMGIMPDIGDWVLNEGLRQLHQWHTLGYDKLTLSINASKTQMMDDRFFKEVSEKLREYDIRPDRLGIEITESDVCDYLDKITEFTTKLKQLGVKISLDDFGVGLSSLNYLKEIKVTQLKVDRSFMRRIPEDQYDCALLSGICTLCEKLNIEVVTEGVETKQQFEYIANQNHKMQGYYFSHPVLPDQLEEQLRRLN
ncbi:MULTISPECIES: EAL domain-containing protein [Bacillaceae]|uniref:EAL domain-containing protein n=1 Tax=Evansella alkalicola TaxID=745819 RepID=A0ABS6JYT9_9BACI|nr:MULTISPECIES: EAL domain-containing protein [Bacillaceae]MBU9723754.1 EAL domain-containing protein [Bacillus alkalicola]